MEPQAQRRVTSV